MSVLILQIDIGHGTQWGKEYAIDPIRKIFKSNENTYKLNKIGCNIFKFLWNIHPKLVSGGIGFVCRKV